MKIQEYYKYYFLKKKHNLKVGSKIYLLRHLSDVFKYNSNKEINFFVEEKTITNIYTNATIYLMDARTRFKKACRRNSLGIISDDKTLIYDCDGLYFAENGDGFFKARNQTEKFKKVITCDIALSSTNKKIRKDFFLLNRDISHSAIFLSEKEFNDFWATNFNDIKERIKEKINDCKTQIDDLKVEMNEFLIQNRNFTELSEMSLADKLAYFANLRIAIKKEQKAEEERKERDRNNNENNNEVWG